MRWSPVVSGSQHLVGVHSAADDQLGFQKLVRAIGNRGVGLPELLLILTRATCGTAS